MVQVVAVLALVAAVAAIVQVYRVGDSGARAAWADQVTGSAQGENEPVARIGICEDDPAIRRVVLEALRLTGHEGVAAHTGGEAVRMFGHDDSLDVLVLDIGLPDADGRDVCQALRSGGQTAPVIFLTALDTVHDKLAGFSAGADDYLASLST